MFFSVLVCFEFSFFSSDWRSSLSSNLFGNIVFTNAVREYKSYYPDISSNDFIGIPIEDDGGAGTAGAHSEESETRILDGNSHPALGTELMTGAAESGTTTMPLSRISIGMLEDIGYGVDYSKADDFNP